VSISLFVGILPYALSTTTFVYPKLNFLVFAFIVLYALFATANSSIDAIKYAEFRARFLEIIDNKRENPK
jgi:2-keto-4-pentenoate hydratase